MKLDVIEGIMVLTVKIDAIARTTAVAIPSLEDALANEGGEDWTAMKSVLMDSLVLNVPKNVHLALTRMVLAIM